MSPSHPNGRWWARPVLGLVIIIVAVAGIILARHAVPSSWPAVPQSMSAAPSVLSSLARPSAGGAKPWGYQTATPSIDIETSVRNTITTATTLLLTGRHDSSGNLRTWDRIDERLTRLATPGLCVWFTEIPVHQARGIVLSERIAGVDCHPTTASTTVWEGTIIVRLTSPVDPRDLSIHVRTVPSDGAWRLGAWDIDGDDTVNQESVS